MKNKIFIFLFTFFVLSSYSQNSGQINGDFSLNLQSYVEDEAINAEVADEVVLNNAFLNLIKDFLVVTLSFGLAVLVIFVAWRLFRILF